MILRRRQSKADRIATEVKKTPAAVLIVTGAVVAGGLLALAYWGRRRLWQAVAVAADVVEEAVDTVEDAAEDVRDFARERAETS